MNEIYFTTTNFKYNNFVKKLNFKIKSLEKIYSNYIFLCVGTNKIIGDAFGPLVGEKLLGLNIQNKHNIHILGSKKDLVTYINVEEKIDTIKTKYLNPCIIAIDSALGNTENIGKLIILNNEMKLGEGVGRKEKRIGNISIKAIVNKNSKVKEKNYNILQNTSRELINELVQITSYGIQDVLKRNV